MTKLPMTSVIIPKRNFQGILREFRQAPNWCTVVKLDNGYEVIANQDGNGIQKNDVLVKAMGGHRGYLVRHVEGLLE